MTLSVLDWSIVFIPLLVVIVVAVKTQRYCRTVADFMAGGRAGGRYLVANASGEIGMGAITFIAVFQLYIASGFCIGWWKQFAEPLGLIVVLTGFIIYRYRESRVLTLAEFFEKRYSKGFRIFTGLLAGLSGLLNFALFPIVGARFFVYYCGFPERMHIAGATIATEAVVMFILLGAALLFTLAGGQLTVMVTDCLEGIISGVMCAILAIALLWLFSWSQIVTAMSNTPPGKSLLNPFDTQGVHDFNLWYVAIGVVGSFYNVISWQGGHAFRASAISAHEAKMGNIMSKWRGYSRHVMILLLAICAYTYLHHPAFASGANWVNDAVAQIQNKQTADQMRVPLAASHFLPVGLKGLFAAIMLFAGLACDSAYLHSFGSIFAQDVILPFVNRPLSTRDHIRVIRLSILVVAIFSFFYGLFFPQTQYLLMYMQVTAAIFIGGAGSAILGGFYWRKGTTEGAYAGMMLGSVLALVGAVVPEIHPNFPINGVWMSLISMVGGVLAYGVVSMLTYREDFELDRILHRGKWAFDENGKPLPTVPKPPRNWKALLGIDSQFTRGDIWSNSLLFAISMLLCVLFLVITGWHFLIRATTTQWWAGYWYVIGIMLPLVLGVITTVWFTIGGVRDMRQLFRDLRRSSDDRSQDHLPMSEPKELTEGVKV